MSALQIDADMSLDNLKKWLTCSLCSNPFSHPKTLPCFHSFCNRCISTLAEPLSCPTCEAPFTIPKEGFPESKIIKRISKLCKVIRKSTADENTVCGQCGNNPSSMYCEECKIYSCIECFKIHESWKPLAGHRVMKLEVIRVKLFELCNVEDSCSIHDTQVREYYCVGCQTLVCAGCLEVEHKDHEIQRVSDSRYKHQLNVDKAVKDVEKAKMKIRNSIAEIEKRKKEIRSKRQTFEDEIHRKIKELEEKLISKLRSLVNPKLANLDAQIVVLTEELELLTKHTDAIEGTKNLQQLLELLKAFVEEQTTHHQVKVIEYRPAESANLSMKIDFSRVNMIIEHSTVRKKIIARIVTRRDKMPMVNQPCTWTVFLKYSNDNPVIYPAKNIVSYLDVTREDDSNQSSRFYDRKRVNCTVKETDVHGMYMITFTPLEEGPHKLRIRCNSFASSMNPIKDDSWIHNMKGDMSFDVHVLPAAPIVQNGESHANGHDQGHPLDNNHEDGHTKGSTGISNRHSVYIFSKTRGKQQIGSIMDTGIDSGCRPKGIDYTSKGNVVLVNYDADLVMEASANGDIIHCIRTTGKGEREFDKPTVITADRRHTGKIFISEEGNQRVQVLNPDFTFSHFIPGICPSDMAFDSKGHLYTLNQQYSNHVIVLDIQGNELRKIELKGNKNVSGDIERVLNGIAIDSNELMFITSSDYDKKFKTHLKSCITSYTTYGKKIEVVVTENGPDGGSKMTFPSDIEIP